MNEQYKINTILLDDGLVYFDNNNHEVKITFNKDKESKILTKTDTKLYIERFNKEDDIELLDPEVSKEVFNPEWPIYTRTYDSAPVKYAKGAEIKGSFISNGSIIKGKVENSILGRGVVVEEGAVVKNCVLFSDAHVGKDCHLEYVIADKETEVSFNKNIKGTKEKPLVIKEGDLV